MNTAHYGKIEVPLPLMLFSYCKKNVREKVLSIAFILMSYCLHACPPAYPISFTPTDILKNLLSGEFNAKPAAVKWSATPGDIYEFNGLLGEKGALYSFVDTTMVIERENEKIYYTIFRTASMVTNEEDEFVNANNCHVCGVNLGYFSYTIENDSIYVNKFKRNFATHGSFGTKAYTLSMINLGDGYELLKVDDPYQGMGVSSVATRFYQDGELMLSMISQENNSGNRDKGQKGHYEFKTNFLYNDKEHAILIKQTGYRINEKSGKKILTNKTKKLIVDNDTLRF